MFSPNRELLVLEMPALPLPGDVNLPSPSRPPSACPRGGEGPRRVPGRRRALLGVRLERAILALAILGASGSAPAPALGGTGIPPAFPFSSSGASWFGVNTSFDLSPEFMREKYELLSGAGLDRLRLQVWWPLVEQQRGVYDFSFYHAVIDPAGELGMHPYLNLAGPWNTLYTDSTFADTLAAPTPDRPEYFQAWLHFVEAAVAEFCCPEGGPAVHDWEVWNEPNISLFWRPVPDPAAYVDLLLPTVEAIRRVEPAARILLAGLAPTGDGGQPIADYLDSCLAVLGERGGVDATIDIVPIHTYRRSPEAPLSPAYSSYVEEIGAIRSILSAHGSSAPLWINEIGYKSVPGDTLVIKTANPSPRTQAAYLGRDLLLDRALGIAHIDWYRDFDIGSVIFNQTFPDWETDPDIYRDYVRGEDFFETLFGGAVHADLLLAYSISLTASPYLGALEREAEDFLFDLGGAGLPVDSVADPEASGGWALTASESGGLAALAVTVPDAGPYTLWGRIAADSGGVGVIGFTRTLEEPTEFLVAMNRWPGGGYGWSFALDQALPASPIALPFVAGTETLYVLIGPGSRLDTILLKREPEVPTPKPAWTPLLTLLSLLGDRCAPDPSAGVALRSADLPDSLTPRLTAVALRDTVRQALLVGYWIGTASRDDFPLYQADLRISPADVDSPLVADLLSGDLLPVEDYVVTPESSLFRDLPLSDAPRLLILRGAGLGIAGGPERSPRAPLALGPAFPNPARGTVSIPFSVGTDPLGIPVRLSIHTIRGHYVRTLLSGTLPPGPYVAGWDGRDEAGLPVPSGAYVVSLTGPAERHRTKIVIVR